MENTYVDNELINTDEQKTLDRKSVDAQGDEKTPHDDQLNENTAKLVLHTFFSLRSKEGISAEDISNYLQKRFGDVWRLRTLTEKAEETLQKSAALGFLERYGNKYIANMIRTKGCRRRRRRRSRRKCSCRCKCSRRRRRRRKCSRRRRRRRC